MTVEGAVGGGGARGDFPCAGGWDRRRHLAADEASSLFIRR